MKICVFFGHRDAKPEIREALKTAIQMMIEQDITEFWCGGYGNFDRLAASVVKEIKANHPEIQLILVRAYLSPENDIEEMYDGTIYPEGLEYVPKRFAISRRNLWMAHNCDAAIVYVTHSFGGAYTACTVAKKAGKYIIYVETQKNT